MGGTRAARHQRPRRPPVHPGCPGPDRAAGLRQRLGSGVPPGQVAAAQPGNPAREGSRRHRLRANRPAVARRPGQALVPVAAVSGAERRRGRARRPGAPEILRLPGSPCPRRRPGIHRPHAAGTLPGRPGRQPQSEQLPGTCLGAERIPPRHPTARLGRRLPARHCGLLSRGLPQARPAASPGGRRPCDGPGRGPREPGPLGQPRLPADHHDPDPLRAADLQRRQPSLGLHRHRRRRRPLTCATATPR